MYHVNLQRKNRGQAGFTIIEVLIVLAIAGLILLIVFLAVPALQRNGRNTTKRSDASKVMGAVGEFTAANRSKIPVNADVSTLQTSANLSNGTTVSANIYTSKATVTSGTVVGTSEIMVATGVTCDQSASMVTAATLANTDFGGIVKDTYTRSYVALFQVESAGGKWTTQCVGS